MRARQGGEGGKRWVFPALAMAFELAVESPDEMAVATAVADAMDCSSSRPEKKASVCISGNSKKISFDLRNSFTSTSLENSVLDAGRVVRGPYKKLKRPYHPHIGPTPCRFFDWVRKTRSKESGCVPYLGGLGTKNSI
jgi:hypothetical protein